MDILTAQKEMRTAFLGGFAGQFISGLIWIAAAAVSLLVTPFYGMAFLFLGSFFIFPLTQSLLRLIGRPAKVDDKNKLWGLGTQTAFMMPINFLLVGAATLFQENWFFPAAMIILGSHYLPFITLYGMKMFAFLAALLVLTGTGLALYGPNIFSLGGWFTGVVLIIFAFIGRQIVLREERHESSD